MNDYLRQFPPLVSAPPDLPFFDVRRIAQTLLYLTTRLDNCARRANGLLQERDEAQEAAGTYHEAWQDAATYWKAEREALRLRVAELEQALTPVAAWAAASLQAKHDNQNGFMPGEAFVCGVNDVKLTVNDLRALIEVSEDPAFDLEGDG